MNDPNDCELILEFAETRSESAFRAIVERHAGMVQGTAQRLLRDVNKAEEVTQAVFILLARKSRSLPKGTCLAGWLYRTARYVALEAMRADARREKWNEVLAGMNESAQSESTWSEISHTWTKR